MVGFSPQSSFFLGILSPEKQTKAGWAIGSYLLLELSFSLCPVSGFFARSSILCRATRVPVSCLHSQMQTPPPGSLPDPPCLPASPLLGTISYPCSPPQLSVCHVDAQPLRGLPLGWGFSEHISECHWAAIYPFSVAGTRLGARCIEKGDRVPLLRLPLTSPAEGQSRRLSGNGSVSARAWLGMVPCPSIRRA